MLEAILSQPWFHYAAPVGALALLGLLRRCAGGRPQSPVQERYQRYDRFLNALDPRRRESLRFAYAQGYAPYEPPPTITILSPKARPPRADDDLEVDVVPAEPEGQRAA